MEYNKNRALFRDKCNQSWVLRPRRRDSEHGSSHHRHRKRWCWCAHQGVHTRVCQCWCQGVRTLGRPFAKVSVCRAAARHHPGAMAGGSEPSLSPLLGSRHRHDGAPGMGRQPCPHLPAPATASWEGWGRSRSRGGREGMVGMMTMPAAPPAAPWDQHDTVGLGTGEGTFTHPIPGRLVRPQEPCVHTALGLLQPVELSSDAHARARTHTHTRAHTHPHTHAALCFPRRDSSRMRGVVYPQPRPRACPACACPQGHACRAGARSCTCMQVPAHPHRACVHTGTCQPAHTHTHAPVHTELCTCGGVFAHAEAVHTHTCAHLHVRLCTDTLVHAVPVHSSTPLPTCMRSACTRRACARQHTSLCTPTHACSRAWSCAQGCMCRACAHQYTCAHLHVRLCTHSNTLAHTEPVHTSTCTPTCT